MKKLLLIALVAMAHATAWAGEPVEDENRTEVEDYSRFVPYAIAGGLKALGYEGRSSWNRLATSAIASNAVMAISVNAMKHSVKEVRPDHSDHNSFPSGHAAAAFVAATVLHKEYGMTRSPWFSVGGYGIAMGTGFMRAANNHHWTSDVMVGAGIGIVSTELGYLIGDLIFKDKGILRNERVWTTDPEHPSFFDVEMGVGLHSRGVDFDFGNGETVGVKLGTSATVGAEGAYFLNRNVGVGGLVRATSTPTEVNGIMDVSVDAGLYGNVPLGARVALGGKVLAGTRLAKGYDYGVDRITAGGASLNYVMGVSLTYWYRENFAWKLFLDYDSAHQTYYYKRDDAGTEASAKKHMYLWTAGASFGIRI